MAKWTVARHRDVVAYLVTGDLAINAERKAIRAAIESLESGVPDDAHFMRTDDATGLPMYRWLEARHWVHFIVNEQDQWIRVLRIESATVE